MKHSADIDETIEAYLKSSRSISERFLVWLAHPDRQRKLRTFSRGSFIGCQIANVLLAVYACVGHGVNPGFLIIGVVVAFIVSFLLIHCVAMAVVLPAYLTVSGFLTPAKGLVVGLLVGSVYGVACPWLRSAAFYSWGMLSPFTINLWLQLEPWQTGIFFGSIYGGLIGGTIGMYEKKSGRSPGREQPNI